MTHINQKVKVSAKKPHQNVWLPLKQAIIPLDIDVTPFDGYAPSYAYLSTEGYIIQELLEEFLIEAHVQGIEPVIESGGKYIYDFFLEQNGYLSAVWVTEHWSDAHDNFYLLPRLKHNKDVERLSTSKLETNELILT